MTVFKYFGNSNGSNPLQSDDTLSVTDLINMFKKAKLLEDDRITMVDFISVIEKYHSNGSNLKLTEKLSEAQFKTYLKANPKLIKINAEIQAYKDYRAKVAECEKDGKPTNDIPVVREMTEEERKHREDTETADAMKDWHDSVLSQHIMFAKGAEIIFSEFREIIVEIAIKLKDKIDPTTGKKTVIVQKFVEDWFLRRL
jgi:hypothetical protein